MKGKKKLVSLLMVLGVAVLSGCTNSGTGKTSEAAAGGTAAAAPASDQKVACILGVGGLGDQAFNDLIYQGLVQAKDELGVAFDYAEPSQVSEFELMMRDMSSSGEYAVIICVGFDQTDALSKVAPEFPDQKYAFIDGSLEQDNVVNYAAKEEEGSFLAGVLAGMMKKQAADGNNKIGFIAALETPILLKWNAGYYAGARYVNEEIECISDFVAGDNPFGDTTTAKELAISQYNQGADIIFHAAGGAGLGLFDAAKEYDFYAIGCNSNQNIISPDVIAGSVLKRVDTAAYDIVKATVIDNNLKLGSTVTLGIADQGMDFTTEGSNVAVPEEILAVIEEVKQKIAEGTLVVPTTMEEVDTFAESNHYQAK